MGKTQLSGGSDLNCMHMEIKQYSLFS